MRYVVSQQANEDLFEIWTYIAERNEAVADRVQFCFTGSHARRRSLAG